MFTHSDEWIIAKWLNVNLSNRILVLKLMFYAKVELYLGDLKGYPSKTVEKLQSIKWQQRDTWKELDKKKQFNWTNEFTLN